MKMKQFVKDLNAKDPDINPPVGDISVQRLIDGCLLSLYREVRNLEMMSASGKLDAASARDLRDHLKVLFELQAREGATLKGMTDEQLKELASKILSGEIKADDSK